MTQLVSRPPTRPVQHFTPLAATLRYAFLDFRRNMRMPEAVFFTLVLPSALYLMFRGMSDYAEVTTGHGNVAAYLMTSMALYGAVVATSNIAGSAAVERAKGWGRTLALTPAPGWCYVTGKVLVAVTMSVLPVALVMTVGRLTGAELAGWRWLATAVIIVVGSTMLACYGLAAGLLFRSETAMGVASGLLVVLAFFGNLLIPVSGVMLTVARFTPLYGLAGLVRWPQLEGSLAASGPSAPPADDLWVLVLNAAAWTTIFIIVASVAVRGRTSRV